jgi:hypothetical protein
MLQSLYGGLTLGSPDGSGTSGANNFSVNCADQHSVVGMTEKLTFSGSIVGLLMFRALFAQEP